MINFPNSPATNDLFTDGSGVQWRYTGVYWEKVRETAFGSYFGMPVLDEDDMVSNRDDALATQQSIVSYVGVQMLGPPPINNVASVNTLTATDLRRLKTYSYGASQVGVTVPPDTFVSGDWFWLQSLGALGLTLITTGLTVNASSVTVSQYGALTIIFTASNTISVFGGEPA